MTARQVQMYAVNINANVHIWHKIQEHEGLKQRTFGGLEVALALRIPKTVAADIFYASNYNDNRDHIRFMLSELRKTEWALITLSNAQEKFIKEMEKLLS